MSILAQNNVNWFLLPAINTTVSKPAGYGLHIKSESRFGNNRKEGTYPYLHTDLSIQTFLKTKLGVRLGLGYLIRITEEKQSNRYIQQLSWITRKGNIKLGHRFVTDQTFSKNSATNVRIRYRINSKIPLRGQRLDKGEFYVKPGLEYLAKIKEREINHELRIVPALGFVVDEKQSIECNIQYRNGNIQFPLKDQRLFLGFSWYIKEVLLPNQS